MPKSRPLIFLCNFALSETSSIFPTLSPHHIICRTKYTKDTNISSIRHTAAKLLNFLESAAFSLQQLVSLTYFIVSLFTFSLRRRTLNVPHTSLKSPELLHVALLCPLLLRLLERKGRYMNVLLYVHHVIVDIISAAMYCSI